MPFSHKTLFWNFFKKLFAGSEKPAFCHNYSVWVRLLNRFFDVLGISVWVEGIQFFCKSE